MVATNCLRMVIAVSLSPLFVAVNKVFTGRFARLNREIFFSASCNLQINLREPVPPVAAVCKEIGLLSCSVRILSPLFAPLASVPSKSKKEAAVATALRAMSAVKSCPASASSHTTDLTCSNDFAKT